MHSPWRFITYFFFIFLTSLLALRPAEAEVIVPAFANNGFIQTSGPNSQLNVGDWWTNDEGELVPHRIVVNVPCTPNQTFVFQLFDPESNASGLGVLDEVLGTADNTFFQLYSPGGALLANETYTPLGGTNDAWATLHTTTMPANPIFGTHCGEFIVESTTGDNDENGWRFRLLGGGDPEIFDASIGFDGIPGSGDEAWIGLLRVSYQHRPPGAQTFYWYVDDGDVNLFMRNFDLDNNAPVVYTTPSGINITGTTSGNGLDGPLGTGWNSSPMADVKPNYNNMATFDAVTDFVGDAIANPEPGLWSATLTVGTGNQYTFEVDNRVVFMDPPALPRLTIDKDDNTVFIPSPGVTVFTLTLTNEGPGAALPIPGPEIVDQLPPGMSFNSCVVNAPLVGVCTHMGGGLVHIDLQPQPGIPAFLPGNLAPNNSGTITLTVNIDPGLPDGTNLTNTARVDWTDIFRNNYQPVQDDDTDIVQGGGTTTGGTTTGGTTTGGTTTGGTTTGTIGGGDGTSRNTAGGGSERIIEFVDPFLTKRVEPPFSLPGEIVTWFITVTNPGTTPVPNVVITDTLPQQIVIIRTQAIDGVVSVNGTTITYELSSLGPGQSQTLIVTTRVRDTVTPPYSIVNVAEMVSPVPARASARVLSVGSLPQTGETPWWRGWALLGLAGVGVGVVVVVYRAGKRGYSAP